MCHLQFFYYFLGDVFYVESKQFMLALGNIFGDTGLVLLIDKLDKLELSFCL